MTELIQFINCRILRNHKIIEEDLWVRNGKIENPEKIFFDEKTKATKVIDCSNTIIAPGFIELQINGGFGHDFSFNTKNTEGGINLVAKGLLAHGVTSFCPTLVTSPTDVYHTVLPRIKKQVGGAHGASVLGVHLEGPFINVDKKGAHPADCIRDFSNGIKTLDDMYGTLENVSIITLAPEKERALDVIKELSSRNIVVSMGHSTADINAGEAGMLHGAKFITHLFNAMQPFHHRDPGLVGVLTSDKIPPGQTMFFGIITDGVHVHPSALRIAYRANPDGLVIVTDAISALGLEDGVHNIGQQKIEVREKKAYVAGTETLCGSVANMIECLRIFKEATGCTMEYVLEAATWHPAQVLNITNTKGTLDYGTDADFVMVSDELDLHATWIAGECVYKDLCQCHKFEVED